MAVWASTVIPVPLRVMWPFTLSPSVSPCPSSHTPCCSPVCRPDLGRLGLRAPAYARTCTVCSAGSHDCSSVDKALRRPRTGLCRPGMPIRFTEFHNRRRALGGRPASWQRLDVLLVPGGPGKWLARSGRFIPLGSNPYLRHLLGGCWVSSIRCMFRREHVGLAGDLWGRASWDASPGERGTVSS